MLSLYQVATAFRFRLRSGLHSCKCISPTNGSHPRFICLSPVCRGASRRYRRHENMYINQSTVSRLTPVKNLASWKCHRLRPGPSASTCGERLQGDRLLFVPLGWLCELQRAMRFETISGPRDEKVCIDLRNPISNRLTVCQRIRQTTLTS
jgi:hypothetical protein